MKVQTLFLALTALLVTAACSSQPKDAPAESTPATTAAPPAPAPAAEAPQTDVQACEGKGNKDICAYAEVKGTCVRSADYTLKCMPKKDKKK